MNKHPADTGSRPGAGERAPRVLLLTSTLGSGHLRAAQAVEAALRERSPTMTVQALDFWSLLDAQVAQTLRQAYLCLTQENPALYERFYQLDQHTWRNIIEGHEPLPAVLVAGLEWLDVSAVDDAGLEPGGTGHVLDRTLFRLLRAVLAGHARGSSGPGVRRRLAAILTRWGWALLARRLHARLRAFSPDVVVATQMHPAALFSFVKTRHGLAVPALGVLTDFGMHDLWLQPGTDRYCVPHESIAAAPAAAPVAARISATGIPLMPGFRDPPSQREARLQLHLDPDAPVVLVLGGGLGLGVEAVAARLLAGVAGVQLLVLAGRNASALAQLGALAARYPGRLCVRDWTEQTEVFLRAADVVVGKPGGLTTAEALACGRPLLATRSLRGQESFNLRFLEEHKVGRLVCEEDLPAALASLLANPAELAKIQDHAWALGRRDGAARVAQAALACARSSRRREAESPPLQRLRRLAQRGLCRVDELYHRWHRLQPVGEILYVGRTRYRGPAMAFADGTRLAPGDFVGTLHFNNARFSRLEADSSRRTALGFARLMLESLRILAQRGRRDPQFAEVTVYHGVTWLSSHGKQIGFLTQPFPDGPRNRLMAAYFRLLVWAFAPAQETRAAARPEPTIYWLTREQLLSRFADVPADDKEEARCR